MSHPALVVRSTSRSSGVSLPPRDRDRLAGHIRRRGEREVLAVLRVSRAALSRAMAGLGVRLGTLALIERGLSVFDRSPQPTNPEEKR